MVVADLAAGYPADQTAFGVLLPYPGSSGRVVAASQNKDAACAFVTTTTSTEAWVAAATQRAEESKGKDEIQTGTSTGNKAAEEQIFG